MATPVGHLLAGAALGVALRPGSHLARSATWGALAAAAADLDFIPGLLIGQPSRFHHAESHSIAFVFLAGGLACLLARGSRWRWALMIGLSYASHLVLDSITIDTSVPYGIPILWPLTSKAFMSPVTVLPRVQHTNAPVFSLHNFLLMGLETALLGPLLAWAFIVASRTRERGERGKTSSH